MCHRVFQQPQGVRCIGVALANKALELVELAVNGTLCLKRASIPLTAAWLMGSEPKRTKLSTQDLPEIPAVQDMITWNKEKVLQRIQQRDPNILEDDVDNFKEQRIFDRAFLAFSARLFHQDCGLSPGVSLALQDLVEKSSGG